MKDNTINNFAAEHAEMFIKNSAHTALSAVNILGGFTHNHLYCKD